MNEIPKGTIFFCVAALFLGLFCGSVEAAGLRFALKLTDGLSYISGGDPNEFLQGRNILRKFQADLWGSRIVGQFHKVYGGSDFEGSVFLLISPRFGIFVGTDSIQFLQEGATNTIRIARPGADVSESIDTKMSAFPVNLGVSYTLPLSRRIWLSFTGGLAIYFCQTEISGLYNLRTTPAYWDQWDWKVTGNGLGFFGGLGLEYPLSRHWAIVLEAAGRYAKIKKLTGDLSERDSERNDISRHGTLSYYEINTGTGVWYPFLWIWDQEIIDPNYRNWREAMADFSGFSLRAGIKIYF